MHKFLQGRQNISRRCATKRQTELDQDIGGKRQNRGRTLLENRRVSVGDLATELNIPATTAYRILPEDFWVSLVDWPLGCRPMCQVTTGTIFAMKSHNPTTVIGMKMMVNCSITRSTPLQRQGLLAKSKLIATGMDVRGIEVWNTNE